MKAKKEKTASLPFFGIPKLFPFLKKYASAFILMLLMGALGSAIDIILPLFQRYAINNFIAKETLVGLGWFVVLYCLTLGVQIVANVIATFRASCIEMWIDRDLRSACFNHLQTLSFSYFNQNSVGYIHSRVMSDTGNIGALVSWSFMDCIWHLSYIIGAAVVMFSLNARLAIIVLAVVPLLAIAIAFFQKKLTNLNREVREANSRITGNFNEGIVGAKTIKTLVAEEKVKRHFGEESQRMYKVSVGASRFRGLFWTVISFASYLALALVLWQGGVITLDGVLELGTLSVFITYAVGIMEPVLWIVDAISELIATRVNIERVSKLLETKSDVVDSEEVIEKYGDNFSPKRENWEELHGDIEFRDVSFQYPDGTETVLEHFNLKIPKGTNVAIVGETGAGKSTLVNLVCRFYEPTTGEYLIDGRPAKERSQLWLHSNIGYVLQTPHLFSGTIEENLKYGRPDATEEQMWEALRCVSAEDLVKKMENGLGSEVGEGGDLLSTGEKQLISFARAILADPKILVLDEATSSVDTMTEQIIQNAMKEVIKGRTAFTIAHRLSTIRDADIILVVQDGKIVERGTHKELLALRGAYYRLYMRQYEEESVEKGFSQREAQ
ncbi:MAG: ABC transporter ATP-binding protein [Clostridia bacterium]|nr:ABC transporter ATP-binding protein [Clostridia bacterium]